MNGSTGKLKRKKTTHVETNENENTMVQNLWDTVKTVVRGKYIPIHVYLKKQEKSQINNLTLYPQELEKEQLIKSQTRRKEKIKVREEINEIKQKKNRREH